MRWWLGGLAVAGLVVVARSASAKGAAFPLAGRPGRHWTWEELTVSAAARRLGLDNTPGPAARANLRRLCAELLDPLRERWPGVRVNSAFRAVAVNRAVGGVEGSRHLVGLAADLVVPVGERDAIAAWLRGRGVKVLEYRGHLHVALGLPTRGGS
ncbi:MAG: D-Ala-D-Ala carboxypeptidase family metallohydrolase [Myxococcota bacterium]